MDKSYFYTEGDEPTLRQFHNWHSEGSVKQAIAKHKGNRDHVVEKLFYAWQESRQWEWFHRHEVWVAECVTVDEHNAQLDELYVDKPEDEKPIYASHPDEPKRPNMLTWDQWKTANYQLLREAAYPDIKDQLAMQYDDERNGTTTWLDMQDAIKAQYPKGNE